MEKVGGDLHILPVNNNISENIILINNQNER